jgi:hypothetical protein
MKTDDIDDIIKQGITEHCEDEIDRCMNTLQKEDCVSSEFKQKMEQFIEKEHKRFIRKRFIKRVSCLFIPIVIISCVISFNGNVGADCMDFIRNYFAKGLKTYQDPDIKEDNTEDVVRNEIAGFELTYIPDGFELVAEKEDKCGKKINYKKNEMEMFFQYYLISDSNHVFDHENKNYETIIIDNEKKCEYYKEVNKKEGSVIVWKYKGFLCRIDIFNPDNSFNKKELIKLVRGVKYIK